MSNSDNGFPWYALRIRARDARATAEALHGKGHDVFLPFYVSRRRWSDRIKEVKLPLFPGYLFCRLDTGKRLPVLVTPGVLHIVGTGKQPVPLDDGEIAAIQSIVASRLQARPWPFLRVGQRVRVERGPLSGMEGILISLKNGYRLVLSVTLLQRSVAVEVEGEWVDLK